MNNVISVNKEKGIFILTIEGKTKPMTYDINQDKLISFTGREIKKLIGLNIENLSVTEKLVCLALKAPNRQAYMKKMDIWFNYPQFFTENSTIETVSNSCPKGYTKWLVANKRPASNYTLSLFEKDKKMKLLSKKEQYYYSLLTGNYKFTNEELDFILKLDIKKRKKLVKICQITLKERGISSYKAYIKEFFDMLLDNFGLLDYLLKDSWRIFFPWKDEYWNYLSPELNIVRGLERVLAVANDEEYMDIIQEQQNKIKEIENLSNDCLTIIVPTTCVQLVDDDRQLHNCIGNDYFNTIIRKHQFIYFIRKTKTPNTAFLTSRVDSNGIRKETKGYLSDDCEDEKANDLIEQIDKKIKEIFEREV